MMLTGALHRTPTPRLILRFLGLELGGLARRTARLLGINKPRPIELGDIAVPDSDLCAKATTLARGCEPDFLFNHSVRTYLFGRAIGKHLDLAVDPEVLYLASILHDLALTPDYDGDGSFEVNGARAARDWLSRHGVEDERADRVHEAIALHTAVGIAGKGEPEVRLVHFGAGMDVIGFHREDLTDDTCAAIVGAWPRARFKTEFPRLIEDQAVRKPHCHIAGHFGLGFNDKISGAPFAE